MGVALFVVHFYPAGFRVERKSQRTRFSEQRKILGEKCALVRGKYQTYLEMFEHSPREVCARDSQIWGNSNTTF